MKKNSNLFPLLSFLAILATTAAFLFPLGTGLVDVKTGEEFMGYNFVFGNNAQGVTTPYGGLIAAFTLLIVAGSFQLLGFVFTFGQGGRKFAAFTSIVAGLCMVASAILFFLGQIIVGNFISGSTTAIGWGFLAAGASAAVSALIGIVVGFKVFAEKA
jgi:hypothetical protein